MDLEKDIEKVKKLNNLLNFFKTHGWIPNMSRETNINETIEAIEHLLAEREEDKKKIEELEDRCKSHQKLLYEAAEVEKNGIPKQKVKDLKESIVLEPTIVGGRRNAKTLEYGIKLGKIKACEELLEDK